MEARYYGHDWSGFAVASSDEDEEDTQPDVYVSRRAGTAYHTDKNCTYLTRNISSCDYAAIDDKRNNGGARYYPCKSCGGATSGTVYYTAYGTRYHTSLDCHQLTRDIITIKLDAAKEQGYKPCSKCAN